MSFKGDADLPVAGPCTLKAFSAHESCAFVGEVLASRGFFLARDSRITLSEVTE